MPDNPWNLTPDVAQSHVGACRPGTGWLSSVGIHCRDWEAVWREADQQWHWICRECGKELKGWPL